VAAAKATLSAEGSGHWGAQTQIYRPNKQRSSPVDDIWTASQPLTARIERALSREQSTHGALEGTIETVNRDNERNGPEDKDD
jgi:hypothetical protein